MLAREEFLNWVAKFFEIAGSADPEAKLVADLQMDSLTSAELFHDLAERGGDIPLLVRTGITTVAELYAAYAVAAAEHSVATDGLSSREWRRR